MGQRLVVQIHDGEKLLATSYYHWSGYTWSALVTAREILEAKARLPKGLTPLHQAIRLLQATGATMRLDDYQLAFRRPITFVDAGLTSEEISVLKKVGVTEELFHFKEWDGVPFELNESEQLSVDAGDKLDYAVFFKQRQRQEAYKTFRELAGMNKMTRVSMVFGIASTDIVPSKVKVTDKEKTSLVRAYAKLTLDRNNGLLDITEAGMENSISWSELDLHIDLNEDTVDIGYFFWGGMTREDYRKDYGLTKKEMKARVVPWVDNSVMTLGDLTAFMETHNEDTIFEDSDGYIYSSIA